ncbi:MAG: SHOCT domain-containing protein [Thermoplasmataceae archaeon]|jgi:putative membrane protein
MDRRSKILLTVVLAFVVLLSIMIIVGLYVVKPSSFYPSGYGYGMMYNNFGYWYVIMPVMASIIIVFVVLFFYAIGSFADWGKMEMRHDPVSILKEKLSRGEITEEEYKRKKDLLN